MRVLYQILACMIAGYASLRRAVNSVKGRIRINRRLVYWHEKSIPIVEWPEIVLDPREYALRNLKTGEILLGEANRHLVFVNFYAVYRIR